MTKSRILMAAGLLALAAAPATAMQKDGPAEAEALETRAAALEVQGQAQFGEAASLYRRAASLRMEGDPQAVRNLIKAGKLSYYAGKGERAVSDLVAAGDRALAYGDVLNAATAYLDAGWVAFTLGDGSRAHALAVKGARLSESPLLGSADRQALQRRVEGSFTS